MKLILFIGITFLLNSLALAFVVTPTTIDLEVSGKKSTGTVQVTNRSGSDMSLAVYMKTRDYDELAVEDRKDFDVKKLFLILPATTTIKANSSATIRIVYIGPKDLKVESAYRIIFANLSPQTILKSGGTVAPRVQALISYAGGLFVGTKDLKADLKLKGTLKKNGKFYFVIENVGKKRAKITDAKITISAKNLKDPESFTGKDFTTLDVPILPGQTRLAEIPSSSKADQGTATIEIGDWL
jgi:P pilus assembly chaperone PapD